MTEELPVWCVQMGRPGGNEMLGMRQLAERLQQSGYVGIGWPLMNDLTQLPNEKDSFRRRLRETHHYSSMRTEGAILGMIFDFVRVIEIGDYVVTRSPIGDTVRVGKIAGRYEFKPELSSDYPHLRKVDWGAIIPRSELGELAAQSLKGQRSLYRARAGADELRRIHGS